MAKTSNQIDFIEFPAGSASDVQHVKRFYATTFGWKFKDWGDDYVDTTSSGLGSGFNADAAHRPQKPLAVIYAMDLQATLQAVIQSGGTISKGIFEFPGGKRFHFVDPAGNELAVWSDR